MFVFLLWAAQIGWCQQSPAAQSQDKQPPGPAAVSGNEKEKSSLPEEFVYSENPTTPSLEGSTLELADPLIGETDQTAQFTREFMQVQWRPEDPIDLYVIKPVGVKNPPVVLYLYSYPSDATIFRNDNFCRRLTERGFAAIGFVSALNGQRYHDVPLKQWFVSQLPTALSYSAHDVQMILNYLTSRHDLDMDRVGMFADGSGATIAILAASVDDRIKALDLLDPWGDWPDWMAKSTIVPEKERADYLQPAFLQRLE
ncbi:MAG: alpha/beta hydrolase, partial [Acidobacteriales bacterium]|nr:alpha/beta hydrolase [Terriglobales bacterium]